MSGLNKAYGKKVLDNVHLSFYRTPRSAFWAKRRR
jgi:hypothetical protein